MIADLPKYLAGLDTKTVLGAALVIILIIILIKGARRHDSGGSGTTSTVSTTKVVTTNPNPNRYAYHPAANPYKNKYY